jgi:hypothetical protein
MTAMPAPVHEEVQERARGHQEPGKRTKDVRPMLGPQEEGGDRDKRQQCQLSLGTQKPPGFVISAFSRPHLLPHTLRLLLL